MKYLLLLIFICGCSTAPITPEVEEMNDRIKVLENTARAIPRRFFHDHQEMVKTHRELCSNVNSKKKCWWIPRDQEMR